MENWLAFYQHLPEKINPAAFSIGSLNVGWYALMYLAAFAVVYLLLLWRIRKKESAYGKNLIFDFLIYAFFGLLIGARLGYVLFYNLNYYIANPLEVILPIQATGCGLQVTGYQGMSYHGGLLGIILAGYIFCRKKGINFWQLADFIVPAIPAGYFFGRLGNFLNGELFGRITDNPRGMYFPGDPSGFLRHPSQLYEAFFEGLVLFLILWTLRNGVEYKNKVFYVPCFTLYVFGYGFFRFFLEFWREPDQLPLGSFSVASPQIGLIGGFSLGQSLSLAMMLAALFLYFFLGKRYNKCNKSFRKNKIIEESA